MIQRAYPQRTLLEVLLPDSDKLWDAELRAIDALLDEELLVDQVAEALRRRRPLSAVRGRPGTPAIVVLRLLVLKHLYDWSFDECERAVRGSLVYRAFCRIDGERVPDAKTLLRLAQCLGPETLKPILERLVHLARRQRVTRGTRMRVDTTVVETTIHYPTDSSLLADGVRVLTRTMKQLATQVGDRVRRIRDRTRSLRRRVFEIVQRSRAVGRGPAASQAQHQARMTTRYREAMAITRAVIRDAESDSRTVADADDGPVAKLRRRLAETVALARRVLAQTRARVLRGDPHHPDKVVSLFEPHTEVIRKGKAAKPTEFGTVVKVQEADGGIITDYQVCAPRRPDDDLWEPALERHADLFGHPPHLAVADAGFASGANEQAARDRGVKRVVLPRRGRPARDPPPRPRWYRRAVRWRTGSEGRISVVKRCHGLRRCRYRGRLGMERWVGLGVIAANLRVLARAGPRGAPPRRR